jgi:hypothetical protein
MKYETLYKLTLTEGGVTFKVKDYPDKIAMPSKGFAVGVSCEGLIVIDVDSTKFDDAVDRLLDRAKELGIEHMGTWLNEGSIYIDLVEVFANKTFALGVAYGTGELAIYDLGAGKDIPIKRKGK